MRHGLPPRALAFLALGLLAAGPLRADPLVVRNGEKIGFMGDSITAQGNAPDGYIGLTVYALKQKGVTVTPIPAGVPGHTSGNMRGRTGPQILDQHADWMTLSCGVNDVMLQARGHGVELEKFKENVTAMAEAAAARNVKLVLLTPTPLGEDLANESNAKLAGYADFMRGYARDHHLLLADINAAFRDALQPPPGPGEKPGARLLVDGVHPNKTGQMIMAKTLLLALGLPPADLPAMAKAWADNPQGKAVRVGPTTSALISAAQYDALEKAAAANHGNVRATVTGLWQQALTQSGETDPAKAAAAAQARIGSLVDQQLKTSPPP